MHYTGTTYRPHGMGVLPHGGQRGRHRDEELRRENLLAVV